MSSADCADSSPQNALIGWQFLQVEADLSVLEVVEAMVQQDADCAVVVHQQQLLGIFTGQHLLRLTAQGLNLAHTPIAACFKHPPSVWWSNLELVPEHILLQMQRNGAQYLPVVDERLTVLGLISRKAVEAALIQPRMETRSPEANTIVTHELRVAVTNLVLLIELLDPREAASLAEQQQLWHCLHQSAQSFAALANQICQTAREERQQANQKRICDLPTLIEEVAQLTRLQAEANQLSFNLVTDALPQYVFTDRMKLRQVLVNLLDNAIQSTHRGAITLQVRWNDCFSFTVSDTGRGMSPIEQCRAFIPDELSYTSREQPQTWRLGLAIAERLVHQLGGQLRLQSAIGQGSQFSFSLPCQLVTDQVPL